MYSIRTFGVCVVFNGVVRLEQRGWEKKAQELLMNHMLSNRFLPQNVHNYCKICRSDLNLLQ